MYHLLKLFLDLPRSDSAQGKHMGKESLIGGKILILHLLKLLLVFYSFQLCQIFYDKPNCLENLGNLNIWKVWEASSKLECWNLRDKVLK
jgi:hypothetical protein